jgi:hypothetical protein
MFLPASISGLDSGCRKLLLSGQCSFNVYLDGQIRSRNGHFGTYSTPILWQFLFTLFISWSRDNDTGKRLRILGRSELFITQRPPPLHGRLVALFATPEHTAKPSSRSGRRFSPFSSRRRHTSNQFRFRQLNLARYVLARSDLLKSVWNGSHRISSRQEAGIARPSAGREVDHRLRCLAID